ADEEMVNNRLFPLIVIFLLLNYSTASRLYRHDAHERHCGTAFLDKFMNVRKVIDREELCDRRDLWKAEWYGRVPRSETEMSNYCCKIECASLNLIEYHCNTIARLP
ncbi:hypothetical protein PRIPAC_82222, partial [Pristionchus pacificus]|uniref:Uncharacterized protein n=1 Tax=Pristionchus pacificus TaxID=54126 RepID=A0A2A6C293_PRIPA